MRRVMTQMYKSVMDSTQIWFKIKKKNATCEIARLIPVRVQKKNVI